MTQLKLIAAGGLALMLLIAGIALRSHWIDSGRQEIQTKWDTQKAQIVIAATNQVIQQAEKNRERETQLRLKNEQNHAQQLNRNQVATTAAAIAAAANQRLQHTLSANNANPSTVPAPRANTCPQPRTNDAAASTRRALATCSAEHQQLASDADRLANQVAGLQDYARLCQESSK